MGKAVICGHRLPSTESVGNRARFRIGSAVGNWVAGGADLLVSKLGGQVTRGGEVGYAK